MSETLSPDAVLEAAVATGDAAGCVAVSVTEGGTAYLGAAGWADRDSRRRMTPDTIFYIASMTKAVTSVAAMQCVERGQLHLDEPIEAILPALRSPPVLDGYERDGRARLRPARRPITLRHLLTHTSGLAYATWNAALYEYRRRFPEAAPIRGPDLPRSAPLVHDPGERWEYGTSTDFVGLAVEAVSGQPLDRYFAEHVFAPLGMQDTAFEVPAEKRGRVATRYLRQRDGSLEPEPPSSGPPAAFHSGGGGLYSTAPDYARLLGALLGLRGSEPDGDALLSRPTLALMAENQIGALVAGRMPTSEPHRSYAVDFFPGTEPGWGLGFLINPEPVPGARAAGSLSWGGLYNSYFWLDPKAQFAGAIFTQVLPFADPRVLARYAQLERSLYALQ